MDKEKKLKIQIIVTIVITVLMVGGMVGAWAMMAIRPLDEKKKKADDEYTKVKERADKLESAKKQLAEALAEEATLAVQVEFFRNQYRAFDYGNWDPAMMNSAKREDREKTIKLWRKWMHEWSYNYGPYLTGEIEGAAQQAGVTLNKIDAIRTEAPPKGPENLYVPPNGLFKPTGPNAFNVTITGTLDQILNFLNRIHEGSIFTSLGGGLKLEGSSPRVTTSFIIQPYLLAKGKNIKITAAPGGAAAPAAAAEGAANAAANAMASATTPVGGATATTTGP